MQGGGIAKAHATVHEVQMQGSKAGSCEVLSVTVKIHITQVSIIGLKVDKENAFWALV